MTDRVIHKTMKRIVLVCLAFLFAGVLSSPGSGMVIIPPELRPLLMEITPGMAPGEVREILEQAYPRLQKENPKAIAFEPPSGHGAFGFRLNGRYTIMFSTITDARQREMISGQTRIVIADAGQKVSFDVSRSNWGKVSGKVAPNK